MRWRQKVRYEGRSYRGTHTRGVARGCKTRTACAQDTTRDEWLVNTGTHKSADDQAVAGGCGCRLYTELGKDGGTPGSQASPLMSTSPSLEHDTSLQRGLKESGTSSSTHLYPAAGWHSYCVLSSPAIRIISLMSSAICTPGLGHRARSDRANTEFNPGFTSAALTSRGDDPTLLTALYTSDASYDYCSLWA